MESANINVVELIPYKNFKQMIKITKQELMKNRYVEIWSGYIYSAEKWQCWLLIYEVQF